MLNSLPNTLLKKLCTNAAGTFRQALDLKPHNKAKLEANFNPDSKVFFPARGRAGFYLARRKQHAALFGRLSCLFLGCMFFSNAVLPLRAQPPGAEYDVFHEDNGVPAAQYQKRREQLLRAMPDSSVAFFFSADKRNRQNDVDYEYRQSSDLLYLTGSSTPNKILLLVKPAFNVGSPQASAGSDGSASQTHSQILFAPEPDKSDALWHGPKMTLAQLSATLGVETVAIDEFSAVLPRLLEQSTQVYISQWPSKYLENPLFQTRTYAENQVRDFLESKYPNLKLASLRKELNGMREIKDSYEIDLLQRAVNYTIFGFDNTLRSARVGMWEYQLEAVMESGFKISGAHATGYPSIVGSGSNTCVLHYIDNRRQTQNGDLVLMDCGAESFGYTADITRTFPINGKFTKEQRQIYDLVLEAQDSVFAICKPGTEWSELYATSRRVIGRGLIKLGISKEFDDVAWYFPHGVSHRLGLDVHDVRATSTLKAGFVLTVEPGIYIPQGSPCDERWWNIGVRIEDDVVITADGHRNLSAALARSALEIEALMAK